MEIYPAAGSHDGCGSRRNSVFPHPTDLTENLARERLEITPEVVQKLILVDREGMVLAPRNATLGLGESWWSHVRIPIELLTVNEPSIARSAAGVHSNHIAAGLVPMLSIIWRGQQDTRQSQAKDLVGHSIHVA